jgi:hypothetical protein
MTTMGSAGFWAFFPQTYLGTLNPTKVKVDDSGDVLELSEFAVSVAFCPL